MNAAMRPSRVPRELARKLLETLGDVVGVKTVVLFTADGFEVASHSAEVGAPARIAAIGSSLSALGSAISAEAGLADFDCTTIQSVNGTIVITRVEGPHAMSLAVVADEAVTLGQLLWAVRRCCTALAKLMNE